MPQTLGLNPQFTLADSQIIDLRFICCRSYGIRPHLIEGEPGERQFALEGAAIATPLNPADVKDESLNIGPIHSFLSVGIGTAQNGKKAFVVGLEKPNPNTRLRYQPY